MEKVQIFIDEETLTKEEQEQCKAEITEEENEQQSK